MQIFHRLGFTLLSVLLAFATAADAADFAITGKARDIRGTIQLPLPPSLFAPAPGIPVNGTAMQTGTAVPGGGPATITFPPGVAFDNPTVVGGFLIPVPDVVQLTTLLKHSGPVSTTTLMAGRAGPSNFAFCPGAAANPSCTTVVAGGSQGTINGIIKYTAGPNKFGGTFKLMLSGSGNTATKGNALPATVMTTMGTVPALPFSVRNGAIGGGGPGGLVPGGLSYGAMETGMAATQLNTHPYGYMATPKGLLTPGPVVGLGDKLSNQNTAFPLTTGVFYGYIQFGAQGVGAPFKITSTGYDRRTAGGAGRIHLVGGGLSRNFPSDGSNPPEGSVVNRLTLNVTFTPQPALPLGSPALLTTLGSLVLLAAGFAVARRR